MVIEDMTEMTSQYPTSFPYDLTTDASDPLAAMLPGESLVDFLFRMGYYKSGLGGACYIRLKADGLAYIFFKHTRVFFCICWFLCSGQRNLTEEQWAMKREFDAEKIEKFKDPKFSEKIAQACVYCLLIWVGVSGKALMVPVPR